MNDALREKLTTALGDTEGSTEILSELNTEFNSLKSMANVEKTKGVNATKTLQELQGTYTSLSDDLKQFNYDPALGIQGMIEAASAKPDQKKPDALNIQDSPEFKKLKFNFEAMETANKEKDVKILKANQDEKNNQIKSKLSSAFKNDKGETTHSGVSIMIDNLVKNGKLAFDNDSIYWKNPTEELDTSIDFGTGFQTYLKTPDVMELRKNIQNGGSGSGSHGTGAPNGEESYADRVKRLRTDVINKKF